MTSGKKVLLFIFGVLVPLLIVWGYLAYGGTLQVIRSVVFLYACVIVFFVGFFYFMHLVEIWYEKKLSEKDKKKLSFVFYFVRIVLNFYKMFR